MYECSVCTTEHSGDIQTYPKCGWNLTEYPLSPNGLYLEQKTKLEWAKNIWLRLHEKITENEKLNLINKKLCSNIINLESKVKELTSKRFSQISQDIVNYKNFSQLRGLLEAEEWEQADKETSHLILELYNLQSVGYISIKDFHDYYWGSSANEFLQKIDKLWIDYSNEKFGFTVQLSIYKKLAGNKGVNSDLYRFDVLEEFETQVEWKTSGIYGYYCSYKDIFKNFSIDKAPKGQLPILRAGGYGENRSKRIHTFLHLFNQY
ncbi:GUN4 domain-containing protein [Rivularia sp. UHCC 0363]|uniref:GUN4 domain-containing protein n=1 Tax=Rivularia sp. UHCC 0363 TaxID=3110244 RepID=UPI002B206A58|nr:GUN4 domain-containing protein [Rivularia sp. UHCC 0363]MEA5594682.1 GUN4 domain-containing protein [Rivularia sp. UHCC 0363]